MGSGLGERSLSAPTERAEQIMYTNTIEVISVQAGGMKHLHPVVPPSLLSTPQAIPNGHRVPLDLELPSPDPGN